MLEWSFHLSLQHCGISHFSWVYFYLRGGSGGENRTFLKEWFLFCILSPAFYEKAFSKRSFTYFKSPGSSTSVSFKIRKAFPPPPVFRLALPPGWLAEPHSTSAAPVFDLAHAELQSLGLGLKTTPSTYIQVYWRPLPRTWEAFFFQRNKYISFPVSMRQGQVSFFLPLPVLFLCLRLRNSELSPGA